MVKPQGLKIAIQKLDEGMKKLGFIVTLQQKAIELEIELKNFDGALTRIDQLIIDVPNKTPWLYERGQILCRREKQIKQN